MSYGDCWRTHCRRRSEETGGPSSPSRSSCQARHWLESTGDIPMDAFADRIQVLQGESERIKQYLHALPAPALRQPSACTQWQVQDVVAHLIGVAETYASSVSRGLQGDTAPLPGRLPAGQGTAALAAEGIAQRSIATRQSLGEQLLATFDT